MKGGVRAKRFFLEGHGGRGVEDGKRLFSNPEFPTKTKHNDNPDTHITPLKALSKKWFWTVHERGCGLSGNEVLAFRCSSPHLPQF